ncbi:MAG: hypothetical protein ACOY3Y_11885 [Acidobacteriota bacterium]
MERLTGSPLAWLVVGSLFFTDPAVAQWRAYPGPKRPKKELVLLEKESGIRLLSVNGSVPIGPRREIPAEQPVWPRIWCLPGQATIRLAIECKGCKTRELGQLAEVYSVKSEPLEISFDMEAGKRYLLTWSFQEHRGLIPTAEVRVWVEANRPYLGIDPRGETVFENTFTIPLVEVKN